MQKSLHLGACHIYEKGYLRHWSLPLGFLFLMVLLMPRSAIADDVAFKPAYHKDRHQLIKTQDGQPAIQFDSFETVDWKALAKKHFKAYPLAVSRISKAQLKALLKISFFGYSSVSFTAPVPKTTAQQKFIFLSSDGSQDVVVKELKGVVRYKFDRNEKRIVSISYFGYVLAAPQPNNVQSGGFVGLLQNNQKLVKERLVNLDPKIITQINPYKKLKVKQQTQYRFQNSDESYLVLEYDSDKNCEYGCCTHRYQLFASQKGDKPFKQLSSCAYECDV
jgi:hypothetical protein